MKSNKLYRIFTILFLFSIFTAGFIGCTKSEHQLRKATEHLDIAKSDLQEKNLVEAEKEIDRAIEKYPEFIEAHILRQYLLSNHVEEDILLREYDKYLRSNSKSPAFQFLYARLLPDLETQKHYYENAIELDPKFAWGYFGLGWVEYKKKRFHQAKEMFEKAVSLDPENPYFLNNLGGVCYFLGEYDEATKDLDLARNADPTYSRPYGNLATVHHQLGNYDLAIRMLEKFQSLAPNAPDYEELSAKLIQLRGK